MRRPLAVRGNESREPDMAVGEKNAPSNQVVNVPNSITAARFVLAIVVFVLLPLGNYLAALLVFLLAASTD